MNLISSIIATGDVRNEFMKRVVMGLLLCGLLVAIGTESRRPDLVEDLVVHHSNGLLVPRPKGYVESPTDSGFLFADMRRSELPVTVRISVMDREPTHYGASERHLSHLAGTATFAVSSEILHTGNRRPRFSAFRAEGSRWLLVEAFSGFDGDTPDFAPAWHILEQARIRQEF